MEQARRLGLSVDLARRTDDLVFARDEPEGAAAADYWGAVSAERRRFAGGASVVRRVLALWNPRSLLHSLRGLRWRDLVPRRGRLRRVVS